MTIDEFGQTLQPTMGDSAARIGLGDNLVLAVTLYDVNRDAGMVDISWLYSRRKAEGNDPLFAPYAERHDKNCAPPTLWEEIANLPHPLVDPFKRIFARPDISTHPVIHHQLVSLLISREDLSQVLREHQIVFLGDSAHDWTNHAGTAANAAILDAIALGEVIAESKDPEVYYDQRHPTWLTSFENNAQDFETLHRPQQEWDRLFSAQRETGQKLSGEIVTA